MGLVHLGVILATVAAGASTGPEALRLYGRVTTTSGEVVVGFLRWDRNEASFADFLDASKELPDDALREVERLDPEFAREMRERRSIVAFGMRLRWDEDDLAGPTRVDAAIRFAHIASIEPLDRRTGVLTLRDGRRVELVSSSTDLGASMRDLVVERPGLAARSIDWRVIERVDFFPAPAQAGSPSAERLYGTARTRSGVEVTGWVIWDRDEALTTDVLDGREGRIEYEIPFADIERIEPVGRRSARVVLRSGTAHVLRGTNDVNSANRGLEVSDPSFGRVLVTWEDLIDVRFHAPDVSGALPEAASGPIVGTVYARDGRVIEGALRWGHDEEYLWEMLEGWRGDTEVHVEFAAVRSVSPDGAEAAWVELVDGRTFHLEGTDDVGEGHRGVFVTPQGRARRFVRWQDVERVVIGR